MFVWSKRLVFILLALFAVGAGLLLIDASRGGSEGPAAVTIWMTLNYAGLVLWVFVWMIDQARVRGKNIWLWLLPFLLAPLPALMAFILFLQRRIKV